MNLSPGVNNGTTHSNDNPLPESPDDACKDCEPHNSLVSSFCSGPNYTSLPTNSTQDDEIITQGMHNED